MALEKTTVSKQTVLIANCCYRQLLRISLNSAGAYLRILYSTVQSILERLVHMCMYKIAKVHQLLYQEFTEQPTFYILYGLHVV